MSSYAASLRARAPIVSGLFICLLSLSVFQPSASAQEAFAVSNAAEPRIVQAVDESRLTRLKGNTHPLARARFDRGVAPADLPMDRMLLVLKRSPEQETALRKLLDDQQDNASPNYHKWLTPEQFGKQFGPADRDIQMVTAWLQSHGFRIGQVAKGRNIIEFSGTAAQVQEALHTSIHKYVVTGKQHWANSSDPQIPSALTPVVAGVHTLHNFLKQPQIHFSKEKFAAKYVPGKPPEVSFSNGMHGLGPPDYATIYNINPLYNVGVNGAGTTIAVVARSNLFQNGQDIRDFCNVFVSSCNLLTTLNGPDPGDLGGGEEAEATLDASWAQAIAPGASIDFVVSATTTTTDGVDLSEVYIIDNNLAAVMTESFGGCEALSTQTEATGVETLAQQAAAQGITYMVSSGDIGPEGCDNFNTETVATGPISVNLLASTPYTVAVGGTVFNENGQDSKYWNSTNNQQTFESALSYIPENVWNQSCSAAQCGKNANILAGGGGFSTFFTKPSWQFGVTGIPQDGARDLPDVSLTAAVHDPYLLCLEGSCVPDSQGNIFFAGAAGTSASTPSFAGIVALLNQKMSSRQGQAGYVLYKLAAAEKSLALCNASSTSTPPASTCIFNDVTVGNNAVPGEVGYGSPGAAYQSGVGYDLATGLGSVNVANLVNNWNTVTFKPTATTLSLSPTTITHGQSVNVNITVAPQNGTGTPTGDVSLLAKTGQGSAQGVTLSSYALSGGTLSASTTALPGGSYTLSAHYAGDGIYAPGDSTPPFGPVTVNSEASTIALSVFGYPNQNGVFPPFHGGPYGTFAYLQANVSSHTSQCPPDCGPATGNVNFLDNGIAIGQYGPANYVLNSQGNTSTPNGFFAFGAGPHSVIASYLGDSSYQPSQSSPPYTFTITQAATTTTATAQGTTLAATVATNSGGISPTGTVTFFENGAQVGTPVTIGNFAPAVINPQTDKVTTGASATASLTVSKAPSKSFKATYNGDPNYVTSSSSSVADFTLSASLSTVTVTAPGASANLAVTITALNGLPGTIQFGASSCAGLPSESTCTFSPASIPGTGTTTLTIATKAATAAVLRPERLRPENHRSLAWWVAASGISLAGVVLLGIPPRRRGGSALLSLILIAFLGLSACGGGGGSSKPPPDPGTPAGSYPVVVTATCGALQRTVNFTLTVQ
jgi:hypothetical protein